jgi:hypothetical protein
MIEIPADRGRGDVQLRREVLHVDLAALPQNVQHGAEPFIAVHNHLLASAIIVDDAT